MKILIMNLLFANQTSFWLNFLINEKSFLSNQKSKIQIDVKTLFRKLKMIFKKI